MEATNSNCSNNSSLLVFIHAILAMHTLTNPDPRLGVGGPTNFRFGSFDIHPSPVRLSGYYMNRVCWKISHLGLEDLLFRPLLSLSLHMHLNRLSCLGFRCWLYSSTSKPSSGRIDQKIPPLICQIGIRILTAVSKATIKMSAGPTNGTPNIYLNCL